MLTVPCTVQQAPDSSPGAKNKEVASKPESKQRYLCLQEGPGSVQEPEGVSWLRCCQPCLDSPCCHKCSCSAARIPELPGFGTSSTPSSWAGCWGLAPCRCVHAWCLQLPCPAPASTHLLPWAPQPGWHGGVSTWPLFQIPLQRFPSPRHRDAFYPFFCKVIKRCTCKTLHSGKQIMQNTLSGISNKWIQPLTVGTLLPGFPFWAL